MSDGYVEMTTIGTTSTIATDWPTVRQGDVLGGADHWGGSAYVSWIEIDPNDVTGNTVYVTNSRFGATTKIFRTTDAGATWEDITNNLPDIPVHTVVVQPGNSQTIFIGTDLGVFVSQDNGATWASMNASSQFTNTVVEALEFRTESNTTLYAFTHGRGAWRLLVAGQLAQVYVNASHGGSNLGSSDNPYTDVQDGIDNVQTGGVVNVAGGIYLVNTPLTINRAMTLRQWQTGDVVIQSND